MLRLFRRHLDKCPHRAKGREYRKCDCPIHCDGMLNGQRIARSMNTVNWDRARRRMAELEEDLLGGKIRKPVGDAVEAFLASKTVKKTTLDRYRRQLVPFAQFCEEQGIKSLDAVEVETLDAYKIQRSRLAVLTWAKELQTLRDLFTFGRERKWCSENPAKARGLMPKEPQPKEREPYTREQIEAIMRACDTFGKSEYERRRARAMVLLMRYFGLRASDVATLRRDRIKNGHLFVRAVKNSKSVWAPIAEFPDLVFALEAVPLPMNQAGEAVESPYFFWTGEGDMVGHIKTVIRTLQAVFRKSGVEHAHAHKFRHTVTTQILAEGGTFEDASIILGDSPTVIEQHYAKFNPERQRRTTELLKRIHATPLRHEENEAISSLLSVPNLVLEVGVEPTCPVKGAGF